MTCARCGTTEFEEGSLWCLGCTGVTPFPKEQHALEYHPKPTTIALTVGWFGGVTHDDMVAVLLGNDCPTEGMEAYTIHAGTRIVKLFGTTDAVDAAWRFLNACYLVTPWPDMEEGGMTTQAESATEAETAHQEAETACLTPSPTHAAAIGKGPWHPFPTRVAAQEWARLGRHHRRDGRPR